MTSFLTCMHGLSGSGKTTAAKRLASHFNAQVFHSDVERKKLFGLDPLTDSTEASVDIYTRSASIKTFQYLYELANVELAQRRPVILDAAFLKASERQIMQSLAISHDVPFFIVNCLATESTLCNRIKERRAIGNDPSEATESIIAKQQSWLETLNKEEIRYTVTTFTESALWQEELIKQIDEALR